MHEIKNIQSKTVNLSDSKASVNSKKRINFIDVSKALLIYLVFLGHIERYGDAISTIIFSFHMPAFFIISGFFFTPPHTKVLLLRKESEFTTFLIKDIWRTIIPYFIFATIGIIIHLLNGHFFMFGKEMLKQIFIKCQPDYTYTGAGWFLISMFFAYIWMYFYFMFFSHFDKWVKFIVLLLCFYCAANILSINRGFGVERLPFKLDSSIMSFIFMLFGYYMRRYNIVELIIKNKFFSIFLFIAYWPLMRINGWVNLANCSYNNFIFYFIESICGTMLLFVFSYYISKVYMIRKIFADIGRTTLPMFMMHGMFLSYTITKLKINVGVDVVRPMSFIYSVILLIITYPIGKLYMMVMNKVMVQKYKTKKAEN